MNQCLLLTTNPAHIGQCQRKHRDVRSLTPTVFNRWCPWLDKSVVDQHFLCSRTRGLLRLSEKTSSCFGLRACNYAPLRYGIHECVAQSSADVFDLTLLTSEKPPKLQVLSAGHLDFTVPDGLAVFSEEHRQLHLQL